jgi:hypothetical protein
LGAAVSAGTRWNNWFSAGSGRKAHFAIGRGASANHSADAVSGLLGRLVSRGGGMRMTRQFAVKW